MFYKRLVVLSVIIVLGVLLANYKNIYNHFLKKDIEEEKKEYIEYKLLDDGTYEVANYIWNEEEKKIEVPEEYKGKKVTSIGEFAFCTSEYIRTKYGVLNGEDEPSEKLEDKRCIVEEIELPDSIVKIKKYAFSGCGHLKSIKIPKDIEKLEHGVFYDCCYLGKVELNSNIKELDRATFSNCKYLKEIKLPSTVIKLGRGCFLGCKLLKKVETDNGLPNVPSYLFKGCEKLEEIKINENVDMIGEEAFYECSSLKKVIIPDNVKKISKKSFCWCKSLNEVYIGNNVEEIDNEAFAVCDRLKEIFIPKSVKIIGKDAISSDVKTFTIKCEASEKPEEWDDNWVSSSTLEVKPTILFGQTR